MATIEGVRQRARQGGIVRIKIYKAIGEPINNNSNNPKADAIAKAICDELDRTCRTVPEYQNGLMILGVNCSALGRKILTVNPPSKLLRPDCVNHNDQEELEADVEGRRVQNDFGASELCDVCGLPKANDKMNLNRLGVDDELFGNQYENVQNDFCSCKSLGEDGRLKNETEEERIARLASEQKRRSEFIKSSSVMKLWEEQHVANIEQEQARQKMRAEKFQRAFEESNNNNNNNNNNNSGKKGGGDNVGSGDQNKALPERRERNGH